MLDPVQRLTSNHEQFEARGFPMDARVNPAYGLNPDRDPPRATVRCHPDGFVEVTLVEDQFAWGGKLDYTAPVVGPQEVDAEKRAANQSQRHAFNRQRVLDQMLARMLPQREARVQDEAPVRAHVYVPAQTPARDRLLDEWLFAKDRHKFFGHVTREQWLDLARLGVAPGRFALSCIIEIFGSVSAWRDEAFRPR